MFSIGEEEVCRQCGREDGNWDYTREGDRVCRNCGCCDGDYQMRVSETLHKQNDEVTRFVGNRWGVVVCGQEIRGRYRSKFHYNERIAQFFAVEPEICNDDWFRLEYEAHSAKYGPVRDFTRATVIRMTKACGMQKYGERWKRILQRMGSDYYFPPLPDQALVDWLRATFEQLVDCFADYRPRMPKSIHRKGSGGNGPCSWSMPRCCVRKQAPSEVKERHNFINFNYVTRKLFEVKGVFCYHPEFPVPRSWTKLHALDDVAEKMFRRQGLKFSRSAVMKIPKFKRKRKLKPTVASRPRYCKAPKPPLNGRLSK